MINGWNKTLENYNVESLVREEIYGTVFIETVKDMKTTANFALTQCQEGRKPDKFQEDVPSTSKKFQSLESLVREDVHTVFFSEMVKEWKMELENYDMESLIREDIYRIAISEAVKDVNIFLIESEETRNRDDFLEDLPSANKLFKSPEVSEKENLIQKLGSLSKCFEVEEDLMLSVRSEIMEKSVLLDHVDLENEEFDECSIHCEGMSVEKDDALGSMSNKLEKALQQLRELGSSLGIKVGDLEGVHDQLTPIEGIVQDRQHSIFLPENNEKEQLNSFNPMVTTLREFPELLVDFECMVHEKIGWNIWRLDEVKYQLDPLVELVASLRKKELLYREAFMRRCYNLQKAEAEVDLLGDQVEALLGLLEKIYITLNHYSPVLQHYFGLDLLGPIGSGLAALGGGASPPGAAGGSPSSAARATSLELLLFEGKKTLFREDEVVVDPVDAINNHVDWPWEAVQCLLDISGLMRYFESVSVTHVFRETNRVADYLSTLCTCIEEISLDPRDFPSALARFVEEDVRGCKYTRISVDDRSPFYDETHLSGAKWRITCVEEDVAVPVLASSDPDRFSGHRIPVPISRNVIFRRSCSGEMQIASLKLSEVILKLDSGFKTESGLGYEAFPALIFADFCVLLGAKMNGIQNGKARNLEKPFPGCMGRMVNLFDLSAGMAENRLLTEKAHRDGSPLPRSRSDVAKLSNSIGYQVDDEPIGSELRRTSSNKKSNGTAMKMLIVQEMSKETESKHKPPSVVAKLMGLDTLPGQPDLAVRRSQPKGCSQNSLTRPGTPLRYSPQEKGFLDKRMQFETHPYQEQKEFKDVYEVWQQSPKTNYSKDQSPQKEGYYDNPNEKKMALVRQKFIQAKRLSTDENLRQSKEFQDALEVLSSNKDLFLKFLQEPNSMFSRQLCELQSIPPPPQTKRITVLRPKTAENNTVTIPEKKREKQIKKQTQVVEVKEWDKNKPRWDPVFTNQKVDNSAQPTRIVVLKPSPGKTHDIKHDIKAVVSSSSSSPRQLHSKNFYGEPEDDEAQESRVAAKNIKRQMRENLSSHCWDETLLSSVFSNGYVGDESSFNRSENEYIEGNLSDSEVMTPTSRHSWDYVNRFAGSPYSFSSFSRASYSPESSVCREAKKRLSERWAMMASNGNGQEQKQVHRRSSTLGEMLSLSDKKESVRSGEEADGELSVLTNRSCGGEQGLNERTSCLTSSTTKDEGGDDSPRNLLRSRSVPVSSTAYGTRLNVEVPDPEVGEAISPKEVVKSKSGKSSFKWKVSSLFFSRNKVPSKKKSVASPSSGSNDESQSAIAEMPGALKQPSPGKVRDDVTQRITNSGLLEEGLSPSLQESSSKTSSSASICVGPKQGTFYYETGFSLAKPGLPGNPSGENQDQPSPISVLEAPFEEDVNTTPQSCANVNSDHSGTPLHLHALKSNLIEKSPPIESIARTLSWDDACSETVTPNPQSQSMVPPNAEEEEQEQFLFVQTLLSAAGLDGSEQSKENFFRWHSPESPLDPSLIDKCVDLKDMNDHVFDTKRRQRRSNQRLLFDCANAALVDMAVYGSHASPRARASSGAHDRVLSVRAPMTVDQVWGRMKEWFCSESGDNSMVVERIVRKEVVGRGWVELMRLEVDLLGKEIEEKMLEGLVEESLIELTGGL
ncbi:hypothetical protein HHK36_022429 [Tetracentron sinense]|uniref:DUF4378 domain-containing protein n=1 Tax=Tetracentron sinense TaxID=13715 RepID=A0A835D632_TETSI|nr:hypothetical protein HHK36_022429 [Tetracentron sinense]